VAATEVKRAAKVLGALDAEALEAKVKKKVRTMLPIIEDIRSWVNLAAGRPGDWLIGIHS
jgi:hypothetical protein